jgi:hypothetical protein
MWSCEICGSRHDREKARPSGKRRRCQWRL